MSDLDALVAELASARIYDLSHPIEVGMPAWTSHVPYQMSLYRRHGDVVRPDGISAASELIVMSGHTGTHIDAPSHVSRHGKLLGGIPANTAQSTNGFRYHGVETVAPIIGRGVLVDAPRLLGVEVLEHGHEIGVDLLEKAPVDIRAGDSVLIRTGWGQFYGDPDRFVAREEGTPGPGPEAARWLTQRGVRMCGSDTLTFECMRAGQTELPVHGAFLVEAGISIVEALDLEELAADGHTEFLLIAVPVRLRGATGSPIRPLAAVSDTGGRPR